jgi:uncharacterized protein YutD
MPQQRFLLQIKNDDKTGDFLVILSQKQKYRANNSRMRIVILYKRVLRKYYFLVGDYSKGNTTFTRFIKTDLPWSLMDGDCGAFLIVWNA